MGTRTLSKTVPPPTDLDVLREQTREALDRAEIESRAEDRPSQDWRELTPVINVNVAQPREPLPTKPDSDPPATGGVNIAWRKGVRLGKLPPVAVVVIVLGVAAIAAVAWVVVKTH